VVIRRGEVRWMDFGAPRGSRPAKRRPVVVVQSDDVNASRLNTTMVATITTNTVLASVPGNVFVPAASGGLTKDSVVNVTTVTAVNKSELEPAIGQLPAALMREVDRGLRRALGL
jgi:mRNA interferase MazF